MVQDLPSEFDTNLVDLAYDENKNWLFVSDGVRVLVFDLDSGITNGMSATYVLGQVDFVAGLSGATQDQFISQSGSMGLDTVNERLYVRDDSRVLVFDVRENGSGSQDLCGESTTGIANGMNASCVLGQEDFVSSSSSVDQDSLTSDLTERQYLGYDESTGYLFVGDGPSNRALVFDTASLSNGMNAAYVLGQTDFTSNTTTVAYTPVADKFTGNGTDALPRDFSYDSDNDLLFAVDGNGERVMIFDLTSGITNGMTATYVLGHDNLTTIDNGFPFVGYNQSNISGGRNIDYAEEVKKLYVIGNTANRVTIFDLAVPGSIGYSGNFTENIANDGSIDGSRVATITDNTFVNAGSTLTLDTHYSLTNAPAGLTPVMTVNGGGTTATLTFTGNATSHESANDVSSLTITFLDGAFTYTPTASDTTGYTDTAGTVSFDDAVVVSSSPERSVQRSSTPQSKAHAQEKFAEYYGTTTTETSGSGSSSAEDSSTCPADQQLTQNLKSGAYNGRTHSYTGGTVNEAHILQAHLNRLGFESGPEDGMLGPISDGAIKRMQEHLGTLVDGYVGPLTRALLNESCGSDGLDN